METESKNSSEIKSGRRIWKLALIFLFIAAAFIIIISRLIYLQIIKTDSYRKTARSQHETKLTLRANRGNIYDRNGNLIASTVSSLSLAVDPLNLKNDTDKIRICRILGDIFSIPAEKLMNRIISASGSFVWLVRGVMPGDAAKIDSANLKGLIKIEEPKRIYLYGNLAAQVVGCTNIDNNGIAGIEKSLDSVLKGSGGFIVMRRDAAGRLRPDADMPVSPAVHGSSVYLTIDIVFQQIVEYELNKGIKSSGAVSGTVVAISPKTGEVLAMASLPGYDPNNISEGQTDYMRCRAVTDIYEPGSTFKLITASVALEENLSYPSEVFDGYGGSLVLSGYTISDVHPVGKISFAEAFSQSSNVIFSNIAHRIPGNKFYKYIRDFGFGLPTGIELTGEVKGIIKKQEEFSDIARRFAGFGYGIAVTPIQVANAFAAIGNKGFLMKSALVKEIHNSSGQPVYTMKPEKIRQVISERTVEKVTDLLCYAVEKGTGINARVPGIKIAGKTGTSQQLVEGTYSKSSYTASFAGFFPAHNPQVAMLIILDKPAGDYYGGSVAAPVFRNIVHRWLASSLEKSVPHSESISGNSASGRYVPDFRGLFTDDAKRLAKQLNLKIKTDDDTRSIVKSQHPKPGNRVKDDEVISLFTKIYLNGKLNSSIPDVIGMSLRKALSVLHLAGIKIKVEGSGRVTELNWIKNEKNETICLIKCK